MTDEYDPSLLPSVSIPDSSGGIGGKGEYARRAALYKGRHLMAKIWNSETCPLLANWRRTGWFVSAAAQFS